MSESEREREMKGKTFTFGRFLKVLRGCGKNEEGAAAVEFALIFPVMLLLLMGSMELSERLYQSSRTVQAASLMGDLVTQASTGTITSSDIDDFYKAMKYALDPFDENRVKIYIAAFREDTSNPGEVRIAWRKQLGNFNNKECKDFAKDDLPSEMKNIVTNGTDIVATRVCWEYKTPLKNLKLLKFINGLRFLEREVFLRPRAGNKLNCANGCS